MLDAGAKVIDLSGAFAWAPPRTTSAGTKSRTRSRSCWPRLSTDCPSSAAAASRPRASISNPGCYPTAANSGHSSADRGRRDRSGRRNRVRRQVRRQRRGPQSLAQDQLLRSHGELLRLFDSGSSPRTRSAADLRPRGERVQLHRAADSVHRGILETIYFRAAGVSSAADLLAIYEKRYAAEPSSGSTTPASRRTC